MAVMMWASQDPMWSAKRGGLDRFYSVSYSALSSQKDKSNNNKEKTQIGDPITPREHSIFSNCNHHDFVCSVHIGSAPNFRYVLFLKYGRINLMSSPASRLHVNSSSISGHFLGEHSWTSAGAPRCSSLIHRCDTCKRQHIRNWTKWFTF